jgi:hypothetical protein
MKMNNYGNKNSNKNSKKNSKREKREGEFSKYEAKNKNARYDEKEVKQEINSYR